MEEGYLLGYSKLIKPCTRNSELLPSPRFSFSAPQNVTSTAGSYVNECFLLLAGAAEGSAGAREGGGPGLIGSMDAAPAGGMALASGCCAHVRTSPTDHPSLGIVASVSLALLTCCQGVKTASCKHCLEGMLLRKGLWQEPLRPADAVALAGCCGPKWTCISS